MPSHRSAKVPEFENPTAVHDTAEVQATPKRAPPPAEGLGVAWIAQVVPFHRSAKVPAFEPPTAMHAEAEEQETPNKSPPPEEGLGVAWMDHLVPSHRSARVMSVPEWVNALPTATQAEAGVQSTAFSALLGAPAGFGVDSTLQLVPFHRSARVTVVPKRLVSSPTAVHEEELAQDTPASWPVLARGLGLGTIDHPGPETAAGGASEDRTPVWPLVPATFPTADPAEWVTASAPGAASPTLPAAKMNAATRPRHFFVADP